MHFIIKLRHQSVFGWCIYILYIWYLFVFGWCILICSYFFYFLSLLFPILSVFCASILFLWFFKNIRFLEKYQVSYILIKIGKILRFFNNERLQKSKKWWIYIYIYIYSYQKLKIQLKIILWICTKPKTIYTNQKFRWERKIITS